MKKQRTYSLLFILILFGLDQLSKYFFYNQEIWSQLSLFEPLFNEGVSRGIAIPFVITVSISILCILIFGYLFRKNYLTRGEFSLFIAWTLGNLIDRIRLGGVRDFINIGGNFPVFNFADIFLTIAVILLCIREIFPCKTKTKS